MNNAYIPKYVFIYYYIMTLLTFCTHCNTIIGHLHVKYRKMLIENAEKLNSHPEFHNDILNDLGLGRERDCCRNDLMNKMPDYDLEKYLKANIQ